MRQQDFNSFPPFERPAVGEKVRIVSGRLEGLEGIVIGYKNKRVEMKRRKILVRVTINGVSCTAQVPRYLLQDINGSPMPDYKTEKELEIEAMEKQERVEQYRRLEDAMYNRGYDLEDYLLHSVGRYTKEIHHADIENLKAGEDRIDQYLDEDICEGLGFGLNWILYGYEECKDHPCGSQMKEYLNSHPEKREIVWQWMMEDHCRVKDYYEDMEKRDELLYGE